MSSSALIQFSSLVLAAPLVVVGMYTDVRARRISNRLNLVILLVGLALQTLTHSTAGLLAGLGGLATGLALCVPMYAVGGIGAGDAKFLAAIGAWLGPRGCLYALAIGASLAGLVALFEIARSKHRTLYFGNLAMIAQKLVSGRLFDPSYATYEQLNQNRVSMPYGVFLGLGGLGVLGLRAWGVEI